MSIKRMEIKIETQQQKCKGAKRNNEMNSQKVGKISHNEPGLQVHYGKSYIL